MSAPCPKCGRLYTWDGTQCRNRYCRYGSVLEPEIDHAAIRRGRFLSEGGDAAVAVWFPGWYALDPPLETGLTADFAFWRTAPVDLRGPAESLVIYNTLWRPEDAMIAHGTIGAIHHPELGEICVVDTRGLDYTLTLADGTELLINAEEEPGYTFRKADNGQWSARVPQVCEWRFEVRFSSLGDLTPAANRRV